MGRERELREHDGSHKRSRNYSRKLRESTPLICAGAGSTAFSCSFRTTAQGGAEPVVCVRFPRTRCALLVDCLDLGHESRAALSGQPMHGRRRSLASQPRICRAVRFHNTATSPNLTLNPLYCYMRPFELARTVNIHSSFWDSTTAHYINLPYAASLWLLGSIISSHLTQQFV